MTNKQNSTRVGDFLRESADVFDERNLTYGDNYRRFGPMASRMFPTPPRLETESDHSRFAVFVQIVGKVMRYAANFNAGGHEDSLLDLSTYAAMLRHLDEEARRDLDAQLDRDAAQWAKDQASGRSAEIAISADAITFSKMDWDEITFDKLVPDGKGGWKAEGK